ncbi:MAG: hypothetical protein K2J37_01895 [Ruminococcus sp.]|nr:hypothetical protein [Ruminococcus sp.]MDE6784110.1 hypothetical protein [Ruminococcus sp.]
MTGCADKVPESSSGSENNSGTVSDMISGIDTEKMPEIVFLKYTRYNRYASGIDGYAVQFIDRDGSIYCIQDISEDSEVQSYGITQIYEDFKSGKLDDKKTGKSCGKSEIDDNFNRLCEVCSDENYSIVYPDSMPDVEYDSVSWYGCYYDKSGELRIIVLHESEGVGLDSNNETANGIYSWFNGILRS